MKLILVAGVVLILVILYLIFRITTLVGVLKGTDKKIASNQINGFLFIVVFLFLGSLLVWYSYTRFHQYHLPIASDHGEVTDQLFWITTGITGVVFVITQVLLFYFPFRYQHSDKRKALFYPDNSKIEMLWTVIPAIVLAALIFYGLKVWTDITKAAPKNAEVVEIMGHQFAWKLRYPGKDNTLGKYDYRLTMPDNPMGVDFTDDHSFDDFSAGQMYLPKGRPVQLKIRARDVIHSVFAPHFRLKMDAVPGMPTTFWFVPNTTTEEMRKKTGNPDFNYEIACAEVCGQGHFSMRMIVVVVEPDEFDAWKKEQQTMIQRDPGLMKYVSDDLKESAKIKSGLAQSEELESEQAVSVAGSSN